MQVTCTAQSPNADFVHVWQHHGAVQTVVARWNDTALMLMLPHDASTLVLCIVC